LVAASEDFASVLDSLIICKFLRKCFTDFYGEAADLLNKVTGWDFTDSELRRVGERIQVSKRLFNQREGWRPDDDWLPPRLLSNALPTGIAQGVALTAGELKEMIGGYYQARGLDENGFVPAKKLRELELLKPPAGGLKSCQAMKPAGY
jgi:aldehyde:ferredoxin oxidoreductase